MVLHLTSKSKFKGVPPKLDNIVLLLVTVLHNVLTIRAVVVFSTSFLTIFNHFYLSCFSTKLTLAFVVARCVFLGFKIPGNLLQYLDTFIIKK